MADTLQNRIHQHQNLSQLRTKLLRLHKLLMEAEKDAYEQIYGPVTRGQLLQLLISHEQFAWLRRISERIAQIDEVLHANEPVPAEAITTLLSEVRTLLTPNQLGNDFAVKYDAAFQRDPDIVLAHADVVALLKEVD